MRGIKDDHDKLRSNGDALKVKNAELLNNIYIREEKFRQISDEKDNVSGFGINQLLLTLCVSFALCVEWLICCVQSCRKLADS